MLLSVEDLTVRFTTEDGTVHAINGVSSDIETGETHALCDSDMRKKRGRNLAMVFQDPLTGLNSVLTVSRQITEIFLTRGKDTHADARRKSIGLLERVGIPDPDQMKHRYSHQLYGGIRQRVMIAMALALALESLLLIADEPTTALDVTTQARILERIRTLIRDTRTAGTAVIFVFHDPARVRDVRRQHRRSSRRVESARTHRQIRTARRPHARGRPDCRARPAPQWIQMRLRGGRTQSRENSALEPHARESNTTGLPFSASSFGNRVALDYVNLDLQRHPRYGATLQVERHV